MNIHIHGAFSAVPSLLLPASPSSAVFSPQLWRLTGRPCRFHSYPKHKHSTSFGSSYCLCRSLPLTRWQIRMSCQAETALWKEARRKCSWQVNNALWQADTRQTALASQLTCQKKRTRVTSVTLKVDKECNNCNTSTFTWYCSLVIELRLF